MKFIMLLDHQAAHIYKYMGQNIPNIFGVFELKKSFIPQTLNFFRMGQRRRLLRVYKIQNNLFTRY